MGSAHEPNVVENFETLWNPTNGLLLDGSNVPILNRQNTTWEFWPHCDQKPERKDMQAVQDLMKITPRGCRDGDLILKEGSAKLFNKTFVYKRESADHEEAPPPEIKVSASYTHIVHLG